MLIKYAIKPHTHYIQTLAATFFRQIELRMKKIFYGLLITVALLGTMYACMSFIWGEMCGNQIIEEIQSPNKDFKAIIFTRDCGATTGYSTQLTIIETSGQIENESGNTFIMSDKVGDGLSFDNAGAKIKAIWPVTTLFQFILTRGQNSRNKRKKLRALKSPTDNLRNRPNCPQ